MATKVNLKNKQQELPLQPAPDADAEALITGDHESHLPAALQTLPAFGTVTGEFDQTDMKIPRMELVQGVGDLSETFTPGDIVYNGDLLLAKKGEPLHMSVLSIRKYFRESMKYDSDREVLPRVFATTEEVKAAGLTAEWGPNDAPPTVDKVAELRVAIEAPESVDRELFPICVKLDDKVIRFALAVWTVQRTSYAPVAKQVFSAAAMSLREKLPAGRWRLVTLREKRGGHVVTIPSFRLISRYTDPVVEHFYREVNWDRA